VVTLAAFNPISEMGVMVEYRRPYSFDCDLFMRTFNCDSHSRKNNAHGYCPDQQPDDLHFYPLLRVEKIFGLTVWMIILIQQIDRQRPLKSSEKEQRNK
jgi:hypothetical protein